MQVCYAFTPELLNQSSAYILPGIIKKEMQAAFQYEKNFPKDNRIIFSLTKFSLTRSKPRTQVSLTYIYFIFIYNKLVTDENLYIFFITITLYFVIVIDAKIFVLEFISICLLVCASL